MYTALVCPGCHDHWGYTDTLDVDTADVACPECTHDMLAILESGDSDGFWSIPPHLMFGVHATALDNWWWA